MYDGWMWGTLISALHERAARRGELPDPSPEPPLIPYEYLQRLGAAIHGAAELSAQTQMGMVFELGGALGEEDDDTVRDDIGNLRRALRARKEVTLAIANEIDAGRAPAGGPTSAPGPTSCLCGWPSWGTAGQPPPADRTRAEGQPTIIPAVPASQAPATPAKEAAVPLGASGAGPPPSTHPAEPASTITEAGRTGSIRPTDTMPRPEQVRLFERINCRTKIVHAAVAPFVVVAGVVAILLVSPTPGSASPSSRQVVLPFTGLNHPNSVTVDSGGNVYVADHSNNRVLKLAAGATTQTELPFTGLNYPEGVAVDSAGNVYVTGAGSRVLKLPAGATTPTELPFTGLNYPEGVAVDSAGSVYVADSFKARVLTLAAGATTPAELPFTGLNLPEGVAVDSTGSVYVADSFNDRVLTLPAGATTPTELPFTGLRQPEGVAVDSAGSVYVTDSLNDRVLKLPAGATTPTELSFTGLRHPEGVAVDSAGGVYVADSLNARVLKLPAG
ncbi:NHL repeat-containing protein [Mycobacterium avium]|uniref:NHL repeat-containing protein n=1 Tax=Mycobacterium avium TaxID=1764 RepID=UPI000A06DF77|nr:NHL repeat-containing protein [Mycobacterium avium]